MHWQLTAIGQPSLYEIIQADKPCQLYLDIEGKGGARFPLSMRIRALSQALEDFAKLQGLAWKP